MFTISTPRKKTQIPLYNNKHNNTNTSQHIIIKLNKETTNNILKLTNQINTKQNQLILNNIILKRTHLKQIKQTQIHATELLNLTIKKKNPNTVSTHLTSLTHNTKLNHEPKNINQKLQHIVNIHTLNSQTGLTLNLNKAQHNKQITMADNLINQI